jgi:hypothetical protein
VVVHIYSPSTQEAEAGKSQATGQPGWEPIAKKKICFKKSKCQIPRWQQEGGSRKCASDKEILEKRWRHTLQARTTRRGKTLTPPHLQSVQSISTSVKGRNQEGPGAASRPHPDSLGRRGQGELSGMRYFHRQPWVRSAQPPGQTEPYPGKERNWVISIKNNRDIWQRGWGTLSSEEVGGESFPEL